MNQALSESAFILAAGVSTRYWHGAMGWFETGAALKYDDGKTYKDTRGGVSWSRFRGASLLSEKTGRFWEANADSVFVSRFDNDLINTVQNKLGWTGAFGSTEVPVRVQGFWNFNATIDAKRQYWANFVETGPGVRYHPPGSPPSLSLTLSMLRGVYFVNQDNPRRPNFWDFRAGIWYAFTK